MDEGPELCMMLNVRDAPFWKLAQLCHNEVANIASMPIFTLGILSCRKYVGIVNT